MLSLPVQLQGRPVSLMVFKLCVWLKSFWMKRGIKHDKVGRLGLTVNSLAGGRWCQHIQHKALCPAM